MKKFSTHKTSRWQEKPLHRIIKAHLKCGKMENIRLDKNTQEEYTCDKCFLQTNLFNL